jgi:hypothetical protein
VSLLAGFVLAIVGVYLLWGIGTACLVAGSVLFVAGGLAAREGK